MFVPLLSISFVHLPLLAKKLLCKTTFLLFAFVLVLQLFAFLLEEQQHLWRDCVVVPFGVLIVLGVAARVKCERSTLIMAVFWSSSSFNFFLSISSCSSFWVFSSSCCAEFFRFNVCCWGSIWGSLGHLNVNKNLNSACGWIFLSPSLVDPPPPNITISPSLNVKIRKFYDKIAEPIFKSFTNVPFKLLWSTTFQIGRPSVALALSNEQCFLEIILGNAGESIALLK